MALILSAIPAGDGAPMLGTPAPPLHFNSVLGGKSEDWSKSGLQGKVAVIEFSASWCGPCRLEFPHFNALAEELRGKPIRFVTVTAEDAQTAAKFRQDMKMTMPIAVDLDGSTFEGYWIGGIPTAVVIDTKGNLVARLHPSQLKASDLLALSKGERVSFPGGGSEPTKRSWNPKASASLTAGTWIKKVEAIGQRVSFDAKQGAISFDGVSPTILLTVAFRHSSQEIEFAPALAKRIYYSGRVEASDKSVDTARRILGNLICEQLGVSIERLKKSQPCYILTRKPGFTPEKASKTDEMSNTYMLGTVDLKYATSEMLTRFIRDQLDRPVLDATGIKQPFSIQFKWDALKGTPELIKELAAAGYLLEEKAGDVDWLVVRKIDGLARDP